MSFDKHLGKEHRKPFHGSKAFDKTCRNHGGCPACLSNRLHSTNKRKLAADYKLNEEEANHDT